MSEGIYQGKRGATKTLVFTLADYACPQDLEACGSFTCGDVTISQNEGAFGNTDNLPVDEGSGIYSLDLSACETTTQRIAIQIVDQTACKVWMDKTLIMETYGHCCAEHAFDLDTPSVASACLVDEVWDENIECAHGTDATSGLLLRALGSGISDRSSNATLNGLLGLTDNSSVTLQALLSHRIGTAQAGAAGTLTLDACASAVADFYNDKEVSIIGGTGAGQTRQITDYEGVCKVACVSPNWATTPDCTSVFSLNPDIAAAGACVTASSIADAVWNEGVACHQCTGTFGAPFCGTCDDVDVNVLSLAACSITASVIAADAIGASEIAACAIGSSELAAGAATEIANAVWATTICEPANIPVLGTDDAGEFMGFLGAALVNPIEVTSSAMRVRCGSDCANIASYTLTDDCTTFERSAGS